jgi:chemotaxis protein CheC
MIGLTERQTDALKELVNIAFGLTASKLSEISSRRVVLEVPVVAEGEVATVHQVFGGPVSGDAILLLNFRGGLALSNLLVEENLRSSHFNTSAGEVLTEAGNMLLSACLGVFGNVLQVRITLSAPRLHLDSIGHFLTSMTVGDDELQYAVLATASFKTVTQGVDGRIVIVLGVSSLERLIEAVERWEESQRPA